MGRSQATNRSSARSNSPKLPAEGNFERLSESSIRIGISACLLGCKVRYDGDHKEDRFITHTLGTYFEWIPVCPEVELGLGTPRETMHLEMIRGTRRLIMPESGRDLTEEMHNFSERRVDGLGTEELSGYILKSSSPSCGMEGVRVHNPGRMTARSGRGIFAEALLARFPNLPVIEEDRLCDPRTRDNWIERVFAFRRLRMLWSSRWKLRSLIEFHTAHKLTLLAHAPRAYRSLGQLVACGAELPKQALRTSYEEEFMQTLSIVAARGRHVNVLQHMAGYLRNQLDGAARIELQEGIEEYRKGFVPLIVPLTLLKHHVRRLNVAYLAGQVYLNPHPVELALRNCI
ncbi:MAG TPA: DUF523 and DUF1722 domain-containing protein [Acidobacteriota bacterium]|nr:DUF523 and DUF1722 domain-containing protein [Acidobacteriota bacterium]